MNKGKHLGAIGTLAVLLKAFLLVPFAVVCGILRMVFSTLVVIGEAGEVWMGVIERPFQWLLRVGPQPQRQDRF